MIFGKMRNFMENNSEKIGGIKDEDRKLRTQLIAFVLFLVTVFIFIKPGFYTYFVRKSHGTEDPKAKIIYLKKALKFSDISTGRRLYQNAMMDYIISISKERPDKAFELCESGFLSADEHYIKAFGEAYRGIGHKMVDIDTNNALYSFVKAESYSKDVSYDETYNSLLTDVIGNVLGGNRTIISHMVGDIDNDGIVDLFIVSKVGDQKEITLFKYEENRFNKAFETTLSSKGIEQLQFGSIKREGQGGSKKSKEAFFIVHNLNYTKQEVIVISKEAENVAILYRNTFDYGCSIIDFNEDKILEIGFYENPVDETNDKDLRMSLLKYDGNYFKYYKTIYPFNKELEIYEDSNFAL
jgi:hypothetical protein